MKLRVKHRENFVVYLLKKSATWSIILLFVLIAGIAIQTQPVPEGSPSVYWEIACSVITPRPGEIISSFYTGAIAPKIGDRHFYYFYSRHGRNLYRVSEESLLSTFPEVASQLSKEEGRYIFKRDSSEAYLDEDESILAKKEKNRLCIQFLSQVGNNFKKFIELVDGENSEIVKVDNTEEEIESIRLQWQRAERFWMSVVFEFCFLSIWWLFAFYPGIYGSFTRRRDTRIALSPLLIFLPHYLGYAPFLFSYAAPGGILYPIFVALFVPLFGWFPGNIVDLWILERMPQPLGYFALVPSEPMSMTFYAPVSPTGLLVFAIIVLIAGRVMKKKNNIR